IEALIPLLSPGDIIIDGGNSHFSDTLRRNEYLTSKNLHFIGMGVSGGEEGARRGPSIMPGGNREAYPHIQPMLEAVAAKVNGVACVAHLGKGAAGHYVKMVHNGIEYAIMQLITECYDLLRRGAGLSNEELYEVFKKWNDGDLQSFLIEITRDIFKQKDDITDAYLVDMILDKAGAKGTGKWTSQDALELGSPIPMIDAAVAMRNASSLKSQREKAAKLYGTAPSALSVSKEEFINQVHDALYFGVVISYAQGLALLQVASSERNMEIPMKEVVNVWKGGCIIRSLLLQDFDKAFDKTPDLSNILLDENIASLIKDKISNTRKVASLGVLNGYAITALCSALNYFDAFTTARLPTNLLQAQRDFFGAHTYERIDKEGKFHTQWGA
ncbi:MAG TPA: NADP-dependent phosphogluconate dehydrogenase, partial [Parasegetibacter sp.]